MEHRQDERLETNIPATVRTSCGQRFAVTISNLSCGGAFLSVKSERTILLGRLIDLEFSFPSGDSRRYQWRAFVVQRQANGFGVMFDDLQVWGVRLAGREPAEEKRGELTCN